MGLDGVELVMEIEEEFGIRFSEQEYVLIATVDDLVRAVEAKVAGDSGQEGLAGRSGGLSVERRHSRVGQQVPLFYRLRQVLSDSLLVEKRMIRPDTELRRLIPAGQRTHVWEDLRQADFMISPLGWSRLGRLMFPLACLAVVVVALGISVQIATSAEWVIIVAVPMLLVGWLTAIFGLRWMGRSGMLPLLCGTIPAQSATPARIIEQTALLAASAQPSSICSGGDELRAESEDFHLSLESLRSRLAAVLGEDVSALSPETVLADIIPAPRRFEVFEALAVDGMPVPELVPTTCGHLVAASTMTFATVSAFTLFWVLGVRAHQFGVPLFLLECLGGILAVVLLIIAAVAWDLPLSFARRRRLWWLHGNIPRDWRTIEQARIWLAMCEWPARADDPDHVRVVQRVRELIAGCTGASLGEISLHSRLADLLD